MIQPCSKCKNYDISISDEPCRKCQQAFRRGEGKPYFIASITNADSIRSMTDEELAEFMIGVLCYTKLPYIEVREKALRDNELLDWLKEEVTVNDS